MAKLWKKGRGKLGAFDPLLGTWGAEADSPRGRVKCRRSLQPVVGGKFLQLSVRWEIGAGDVYDEVAIVGPDKDGEVRVWSFTSDGKRSEGRMADVTDLHPEAVGFEAEMPAGLARMAYWPVEGGGFRWVVESRTKKGWNRFVEHIYQAEPVQDEASE